MSFIVSNMKNRSAVDVAAANEGWRLPAEQFGGLCVATASDAVKVDYTDTGRYTYVYIGTMANHNELRRMLAMFDSSSLTASLSELAVLAIETLGLAGLCLIDGAFVIFREDKSSREISVITDVLGQYPVYVTWGADPWFAPNPRLAAKKPDFVVEFVDFDSILPDKDRSDDYLPIKNMVRAKPGAVLQIGYDGMRHGYVNKIPFHIFQVRQPRLIDLNTAHDAFAQLLVPAIKNSFDYPGRSCVPLSGGVDSSVVAAYGVKCDTIRTVALGTDRSDEYIPAKLVATHIGSDHAEIHVETDEILRGLFAAVYHNGIFDGYAAEVQSGLFALMERLKGDADLIVTGYGADLLMGGTLAPGHVPSGGVNSELWAQIYRTRWSGEFSPVGANSVGMQIRHPFWSPRFVGYCLDLNEAFKLSESEVKVAFRTFAEKAGILPHKTVWRKKLAIHHGSAVEDILSDALNIDKNSRVKEIFTYRLYQQSIIGDTSPATFSPRAAIADIHNTI